MTPEVSRLVLVGYLGLTFLAARGLQLRAASGAETLAPWLWGPVFYLVAALLALTAVWPCHRVLVAASGVSFHIAVFGRIFAVYSNATIVAIPGATLTSTALYGVILLSSSLVWRYLLWPSPRRA